MGRRIITQRRGRGGPRYQVPSHRFKGRVNYPQGSKYTNGISGQVISIEKDPARTTPVAKILLEDYQEIRLVAPEGMKIGQWVSIGGEAKQEIGNVLPLGRIAEGTLVYNIELTPGDGGKIVRSSGGAAAIVSHDRDRGITIVKLPSKKTAEIPSSSRATIGIAAGGGRKEKPMVRAGQSYHRHRARNKLYPRVRGVAMNAQNHPHGGGSHGYTGRPASVARNTPPGRKVGMIAPKRCGRRKG